MVRHCEPYDFDSTRADLSALHHYCPARTSLLLTPTSALNFLRGSSAQADATNLPANLKDMAFTALINHKNCQMVFC
jgi:hypothetical protein